MKKRSKLSIHLEIVFCFVVVILVSFLFLSTIDTIVHKKVLWQERLDYTYKGFMNLEQKDLEEFEESATWIEDINDSIVYSDEDKEKIVYFLTATREKISELINAEELKSREQSFIDSIIEIDSILCPKMSNDVESCIDSKIGDFSNYYSRAGFHTFIYQILDKYFYNNKKYLDSNGDYNDKHIAIKSAYENLESYIEDGLLKFPVDEFAFTNYDFSISDIGQNGAYQPKYNMVQAKNILGYYYELLYVLRGIGDVDGK